ncbi:Permeases of the major facilitator superfamily [Hyphomicrobium sulfonivorans]|uniref:Permeases of the major facilitator superfamily n=1 Tax=Hyphomicrobium sulfonivorans TaxID=121290 RepID=A0A109BQ58_HYPSL|nr:nuclear transport factor 2 family protein [Hyphomicrobium sulfonivorans]KWT72971.1 Permeases of the major facilitator superfamily [Hyphomicrobium sulfonivorans]
MGTTPAQDYEEIVKAVQPYLDGAKAGDGEAMKASFHKDATVYGYLGDTLVAGPMKLIYDWANSIGPAPNVNPRIVKVDVAGTAASVRVEVDNWQQHRFTDVFNLLKIDGKWTIVNKIFHTHA